MISINMLFLHDSTSIGIGILHHPLPVSLTKYHFHSEILESIIAYNPDILQSKSNITLFQDLLGSTVDFLHIKAMNSSNIPIIVDNVLQHYNNIHNTNQTSIENRNIFLMSTIFVVGVIVFKYFGL